MPWAVDMVCVLAKGPCYTSLSDLGNTTLRFFFTILRTLHRILASRQGREGRKGKILIIAGRD
jgi:hypothetical protein